MNPARFSQMMKYLTRAKKEKPDLPDVTFANKIPQPPVRQDVETMDAINAFIRRERQQKAGGGRIGFDRGGLSNADVSEIKSKLPEGINIEYDSGSERWRYMTSIPQADGTKKRMRLPMLKAFDLEADKNLKKILEAKGKGKEVFDLSLKIGNKTILTPEKFYELRLKDSKLSLNKFLEKLTKKGFVKPNGKPFGSRSALHRLQQELGIADFVGGESNATRKRSLQDIKAIVRSAPNGPQILKSITDESQLRKIANALVSRDRLYERRGSFPVGRSKENKMWHNLWRASNTGNRIEIIGEFADGKLPIDNNGRVNWQMPNKDGVPAWKRVEFIDNQKNKAPLKWIDMPGSRSLGNQGQLRSQVDSIYGKGFFDRKMKPYDLQKQIGDLEIDLDGQKVKVGTILNENIVKSRLMDRLIKENKGAIPTEAEFNKRYNSYRNKLKLFNSMNVQHTKGVGLDPYTTELTTQSANAKERAIVQKYNSAIKKTTDSTELLKLSDNFANDINKLGGGIRSFDVQTGTVRGTKATPSSLATQLVSEARLDDETSKKILNQIQSYSKLPKCKVNLKADGGRIGFALSDECIRDGLKEQKLVAQQGNKKAARELVQVGKVATRAGLLKNLLGPGALLGEAVIEGAIIGNKVLGGKPSDIAYAESYLSYLDPRKYRGELDPLKMEREDMLESTADKNILRSGFAAQDQLSAFNKAIEDRDIAKARGRIDQYIPAAAEAREQGARADQSADIISSEAFKDASRVAQEYLQGQAGKQQADFGIFSVPQSAQADEMRRLKAMRNMSEQMPRDFLTMKTSDLLNYTQQLKALGYDVSTRDLMAEQEALRSIPLSQAAQMYSPEQVYGTQGEFAGGGIAKIAGDSSGRPPVSGPNSQGLLSLKNRVRNY